MKEIGEGKRGIRKKGNKKKEGRKKEEERRRREETKEEESKLGDRIQHETIINHVILPLKTGGTFQRIATLYQENTVIYGRLRIKFGAQI